ncbi:Urease operon accessory protein [Phyllobacterium brassicacearum]|uniref:Urease operon accessory protein n=1 Tax=Phyllobacterium brassicacearum TaxID=314235 RepID=A0A2P7BA55_9HYPH|nr:Urease operon accessory protein [Phyllobacterium brassicacearum]PSH63343.1 Urease operon accessory protein [Phyllobacterium brassicacearum]TDQ18196.1 hypothetical protein DEV91_12559 [Phyllobacterium brassicacearum]
MRKRIAIVGNGPVANETAPIIDSHDFIIRFNDCRSFGSGATRTDVVAVCNTGRPAKKMLASQEWRSHAGIVDASEIWSVRDPEKFAQLRPALALSHPELDDLCDDYTDQFTAFCTETGKRHTVIDKTIHEAVDKTLADYQPAPYVVPSSGMIVIGNVLDRFPEADVTLAGFGHEGWEWHPFAAERKLVDSYCATGRVRRLGRVASHAT